MNRQILIFQLWLNRITYRLVTAGALLCAVGTAGATPKIIVISLDGATPRFVEKYLATGALPPNEGIGLLKHAGVHARQNLTVNPSLTAVSHIAIATGSTAARNDVIANRFHLVASPFLQTINGFAAPIGGYQITGPAQSSHPTAEPIWLALRKAGKKVVCATFPGADGLDVSVPGTANQAVVQPNSERTVDYTVPFGESSGVEAQGFALTASDFAPAPQPILDQLTNAGITYFHAQQKTTPLESFHVTSLAGLNKVTIQVVALDTTGNGNFDTLVFFNASTGIQAGPFQLPSTGPAYVKVSEKKSSRLYLEGSAKKSGCSFYVSRLEPDLSTIHIARSSVNNIPRSVPTSVLACVDDINTNVGSWGNRPDYGIKLMPSFASFSDAEIEAIYEEQVNTWAEYQANVALRAIQQNPEADLIMVYSEQPDGSEHLFFLVDPRQATNPTDPNSIGANQDSAKVARYADYVQAAYQAANKLVQKIINAVGTDENGRPKSNIFVVSDHGFAGVHTTVNLNNVLANARIDTTKVKAVTSGPAVNMYINLQGREQGGTVSSTDYVALQRKVVQALQNLSDTNSHYTAGAKRVRIFNKIYSRPLSATLNDPAFGRAISPFIGQDSGDVYALLRPGYNFDGGQTPAVGRLGDPVSSTAPLTLPITYGAHGYDPTLPEMSAIFYAAGPDIIPSPRPIPLVHNIDIAPTIARLLGVTPSPLVQGTALNLGPAPLQLLRAVSRKIHGAAGAFDLPLRLTGEPSIECRRAKGNTHKLIFTFSNRVIGGTASLSGDGTISNIQLSGNHITISLTHLPDARTITLTLNNVSDGKTTLAPITLSVSFLLGDVTADGSVDTADINQIRSDAASGGTVNSANFRSNITTSGKINDGDTSLSTANAGHHL